jgi:hypothetical protein
MRRASIALTCALAVTLAADAHADGQNAAAAQALFEEARALLAAGDYTAACAKFEASQALDPGAGTQYNLALCYDKAGRTASAWATYLEAAAAYKATGRADWETKARDRAAALAPTLARLTIVVAPGAPPDLAITRDGAPVAASVLGTAIPVDPGTHVVEAKASGMVAFRASTSIAAGATERIDVVLRPIESTTPSPPPAQPSDAPDHTLAWIVGGVGAAGIAVGTVAGLVAWRKNVSSTDVCPNDGPCADANARSDSRAAHDWAAVSTVGFVAGGVLVAAAVVLWIAAPRSKSVGVVTW